MPPKRSPSVPSRSYTPEELMAVKQLGPGMIGQEMYDAKEAYIKSTQGGILGPAMMGLAPQGAIVDSEGEGAEEIA